MNQVNDWFWIFGNHDHELPTELTGHKVSHLTIDGLAFHHEIPKDYDSAPILIGHHHPKYIFSIKNQIIHKPCFAWHNHILIMPSFGSFTGGIDIRHHSFSKILQKKFFIALAGVKHSPIQIKIELP